MWAHAHHGGPRTYLPRYTRPPELPTSATLAHPKAICYLSSPQHLQPLRPSYPRPPPFAHGVGTTSKGSTWCARGGMLRARKRLARDVSARCTGAELASTQLEEGGARGTRGEAGGQGGRGGRSLKPTKRGGGGGVRAPRPYTSQGCHRDPKPCSQALQVEICPPLAKADLT